MSHSLFFESSVDLRTEPRAHAYIKHEVVSVQFAASKGAIHSREGLNHYAIGDALITGSTGDRWSVSRERFDAKYQALNGSEHGQAGQFENKAMPVLALQQAQAFSVARSAGGDVIHGQAGDWFMQYAPGDHGIVENAKFQRVYRLLK